MGASKNSTNPPGTEPYLKPEVKKVMLRPEEAVLGGCKITTAGGIGNPSDCTTCNALTS